MEKVLLAIDGMTPDRKAFRYAIALCRRIRAELNIFQIIRPKHYQEYVKKVQKKASLARKFLEGSMVAATFAEAGEHETALDIMAEASKEIRHLLQESEEAGVPCQFSIKSGHPEKEIVNYVNNHRNVVLTIYDVSEPDANEAVNISKKKNTLTRIRKGLSVPLVTVQN
ncbi:MAG: universal stress protein [Deltaproteobacteria bacterium]|jgi:nucleotide-binding universal stress UspA family protein|nr:universal stress protein [Deltaproteobacteria bacterium]MBW2450385.1 universal stress protein [Deltaproteobacteria bacterium]MBW2490903.1 universal stress protein [Deltaproteobacteria bacterium]